MKAITQNMKTGEVVVKEVPPPSLQPEGVLVRVRRSLISIGTERSIIALAERGPLGKARARPDLARKVLNKAKQEGYWSTYQVVRNLIASPIPLGYSCTGEIIAVGAETQRFKIGDRVSCAGLGHANHAEIVYVPQNLCASVPDELGYESATFATVGAIAIQGIRLANISLGDRVVVLGLGLVGQIAAQLARCAGATVIATDLDPVRVELARKLGAHHALVGGSALRSKTEELTDGAGADAVVVCAATKSSDPAREAAELSRLKGRVVIVGDVGLELERRAYFEKEIELVVSRSYGPGRYDPDYELHGIDYPRSYVRWTEQRNMESFLELAAREEIDLEPLITHRFPIDVAEQAYDLVKGVNDERPIAILLEYDGEDPPTTRVDLATPARATAKRPDGLRLGVIGAGLFAKGVLLPAFSKQRGVTFRAVCTVSGLTSRKVAESYDAEYCTSDPEELISDPEIDALVIATRHDSHAALVGDALRAGKAVFVEKPLAIDAKQLAELVAVLQEVEAPRLMVGFNRRFAPLAVECKDFFQPRSGPLFASYRVNAGRLTEDHWARDPKVGGGRIVGEVCHFIDTLCFLTDALPRRISAVDLDSRGGRDAVNVSLEFADGSTGVIHYLNDGDTSVAKEYMEVFGGGRTAVLDNYRRLSLHAGNRRQLRRLLNQKKGHAEEVAAFVESVRSGAKMPIDLNTMLAVTQTTFMVHRSLDHGGPVEYAPASPSP